MNFARHSNLEGQHAFLGASNYHWLNYSDDKISEWYFKYLAKERGTRFHALAAELIELGVKLPDKKKALNLYVNDAIGYKMSTEVVLYYSPNCFGTADSPPSFTLILPYTVCVVIILHRGPFCLLSFFTGSVQLGYAAFIIHIS